jgi:hypothetical protein
VITHRGIGTVWFVEIDRRQDSAKCGPASRAAFFTRSAVLGSTLGEPRNASDTVVRDKPRILASERSVGAGADIVGLSAGSSADDETQSFLKGECAGRDARGND